MNLTEFYPTPPHIVEKLIDGIDFKEISTVLEPSAGDGAIAERVNDKIGRSHYNYDDDERYDIDCIEIEPSLRAILKEKGFRIVDSDFLRTDTVKHYDLIVMNPPFSDGDKHLLKALEMQKNGGKVRAIINAQTLKNPYSITRKALIKKLEEYESEIEYVQDAFTSAVRTTDVEIAIVKVDIPYNIPESDILKNMTLAEVEEEMSTENQYTELAENDIYKAFVTSFNTEAKAGKKFIEEYKALRELFRHGCGKYDADFIELSIGSKYSKQSMVNNFLKKLRAKYWKMIFNRPEFNALFTSSLRQSYMEKVNELANYDFNLHNIYEARLELSKNLLKGLDDNIMMLFETFTSKHSWYPECQNNIHYYDGWATNKAYYVNKKVIIPLGSWDDIWKKFQYSYTVTNQLRDIERAFDYLDGKDRSEPCSLEQLLEIAERHQETKNIRLKYFDVTFYKKGTCHIAFRDMDLLKKLNIYAGKKFNWLPTDYGQKRYNQMSDEEKAVVDSFEGEASYEETYNNRDYFLADSSSQSVKLLVG